MTENSVEEAWDDSMPGGFFEDAGVDVAQVSDDPFNFGYGFHILQVNEFRAPKVSPKGKFGAYILFDIIETRYERLKAFGVWVQIPTPRAVQESTGVKFSPKENPDDMAVASDFMRFLKALGFKADELNKANPVTCLNRQFLAKLFASNTDGRWQIRFNMAGVKPMPEQGSEEYNSVWAIAAGGSSEGLDEFSRGGNGGGVDAIEAAMRAEVPDES